MPTPYLHKVQISPLSNVFTTFPIDMLRYDCLYPSSEEDSEKIVKCFNKSDFEDKPIITLERIIWKTWEPTFERWKSFLWTVVKHEIVYTNISMNL